MEQSDVDRLHRVIGVTTEIRQAADQLLATALYLRDRASGIGADDEAVLTRYVDRIVASARNLES